MLENKLSPNIDGGDPLSLPSKKVRSNFLWIINCKIDIFAKYVGLTSTEEQHD